MKGNNPSIDQRRRQRDLFFFAQRASELIWVTYIHVHRHCEILFALDESFSSKKQNYRDYWKSAKIIRKNCAIYLRLNFLRDIFCTFGTNNTVPRYGLGKFSAAKIDHRLDCCRIGQNKWKPREQEAAQSSRVRSYMWWRQAAR